jgi:hypothetical protein
MSESARVWAFERLNCVWRRGAGPIPQRALRPRALCTPTPKLRARLPGDRWSPLSPETRPPDPCHPVTLKSAKTRQAALGSGSRSIGC